MHLGDVLLDIINKRVVRRATVISLLPFSRFVTRSMSYIHDHSDTTTFIVLTQEPSDGGYMPRKQQGDEWIIRSPNDITIPATADNQSGRLRAQTGLRIMHRGALCYLSVCSLDELSERGVTVVPKRIYPHAYDDDNVEFHIVMYNHNNVPYNIKKGDPIAMLHADTKKPKTEIFIVKADKRGFIYDSDCPLPYREGNQSD